MFYYFKGCKPGSHDNLTSRLLNPARVVMGPVVKENTIIRRINNRIEEIIGLQQWITNFTVTD